MKSKYPLFVKLLTITFIILSYIIIIFGFINVKNSIKITIYSFFIAFLMHNFSIIYLFLFPLVEITDNGLIVKRVFLIKRLIKWNNMKLTKKVRKATNSQHSGKDPRYLKIAIKDGIWQDKYIFIPSSFKEYDQFVSEIERHLDKDDISKDSDY